jgi:hypothetical protein
MSDSLRRPQPRPTSSPIDGHRNRQQDGAAGYQVSRSGKEQVTIAGLGDAQRAAGNIDAN